MVKYHIPNPPTSSPAINITKPDKIRFTIVINITPFIKGDAYFANIFEMFPTGFQWVVQLDTLKYNFKKKKNRLRNLSLSYAFK